MANATWNCWVWVKWKPGAPTNAWEDWKNNKRIKSAWSTLGQWDCVLVIEEGSADRVEEFVWKELRTSPWVETTYTTFAKQWW